MYGLKAYFITTYTMKDMKRIKVSKAKFLIPCFSGFTVKLIRKPCFFCELLDRSAIASHGHLAIFLHFSAPIQSGLQPINIYDSHSQGEQLCIQQIVATQVENKFFPISVQVPGIVDRRTPTTSTL